MSDEKQGLEMLNHFYKIIFRRELKDSQQLIDGVVQSENLITRWESKSFLRIIHEYQQRELERCVWN
jgi:hypothetical protein